jgi:hypothetical protein
VHDQPPETRRQEDYEAGGDGGAYEPRRGEGDAQAAGQDQEDRPPGQEGAGLEGAPGQVAPAQAR